jgi:hypothetical protein
MRHVVASAMPAPATLAALKVLRAFQSVSGTCALFLRVAQATTPADEPPAPPGNGRDSRKTEA